MNIRFKKNCNARLLLLSLFSIFFAASIPAQEQIENALLWEIKHPEFDQPSYIFGTMHALPEDEFSMPEIISEKLGETEVMYQEVDLQEVDQQKLMNKIMLPDGNSLQNYVSDQAYEEFKEKLLDIGIAEEQIEFLAQMQPMVSYGMVFNAIFENPVVFEQELISLSRDLGVPVKGLETIEYQLSIFESIPIEEQMEMFFESDLESEINQITELYLAQNINRLYFLMMESRWGSQEDELLGKRNRKWVEKLLEITAEKPVFVAVGAAHLPGEYGVLNLLLEKDFEIKPVKFDF
ncbi:MAG: TraB/GumN family protein [Bacteroidales bacterium]